MKSSQEPCGMLEGTGAAAQPGEHLMGCPRGRGHWRASPGWGQSWGSGSISAPWHLLGSPVQTAPSACPISSNRLEIVQAALFHGQRVWGCQSGFWRAGSAEQWPQARAACGAHCGAAPTAAAMHTSLPCWSVQSRRWPGQQLGNESV